MLIVSLNYRLGVFGFLALPDFAKESPHHGSGNYGFLDQVAALNWIKENIASFGGDPDNVTIFGAGSGSVSVSALMASPMTRGLFSRAIGEGGSCVSNNGTFRSRSEAERRSLDFKREAIGSASTEKLRATSAQAILDAALKQPAGFFSPDIDGEFLQDTCLETYRSGKQNPVSLLAGWNQQEAPHYVAQSTREWEDLHEEGGKSSVYVYSFDEILPIPTNPKPGLNAGPGNFEEVEFVFQVLSSRHLPWRQEDRELSERVSSYWTNFAKTGDPNGNGLSRWPRYTGRRRTETMHFADIAEHVSEK